LGIAGIIAYNFFAKAAAAKRMNFFPGGVDSIHFDGDTPVITITLIAHNTSNQQMTINSLDGNISANGTYIGNASSFIPQTIFPNSQSTVKVDIRLGVFNIVNDIIRAFQFGNFQQVINFTGSANVDNIQVPINMNYTVG
jgi:LEA14-like dessication related protein